MLLNSLQDSGAFCLEFISILFEFGINLGRHCILFNRLLNKIIVGTRRNILKLTIHVVKALVEIPIAISVEGIKEATLQDERLQQLSRCIAVGWLHTQAKF